VSVYFWRIAALLSGLWLLTLLLIRAQPYDDGGLRAFLGSSAECPAPCVMGIRPGVTSEAELVAILNQHPWVAQGSQETRASRPGNVVAWQWNTAAPAWIDQPGSSLATLPDSAVGALVIETRIAWGEFVLALGRPQWYRKNAISIALPPLRGEDYQYEGWYADWGFSILIKGGCWNNSKDDWQIRVYEQPVRLLRVRLEPSPDLVQIARPVMTDCD
jgi:hypothetical protein